MSVDLHSHSTASDGSFSPSDLARAFAAAGIRIVGLTDHDTMGGVPEFLAACDEIGIVGIGGIEFSTLFRGAEVHLLGYGLPLDDPCCSDFLERHSDYLRGRFEEILRKLASFGYELESEHVYRISGGNPPMPTHLLMALGEKGMLSNVGEAVNFFWEYLATDEKAWVPHETPVEAPLRMLNEVGAIALVAHPVRYPGIELMLEILDMGADGFELYYPEQTGSVFQELQAIASKRGCLVSGGCDFHGAFSERRIGEIEVPFSVAEGLFEAIGAELPLAPGSKGGEK